MESLDGVNLPAATHELETFVHDAEPRNGSGDGLITTQSYAQCGRPRAIHAASVRLKCL